MWEKSGLIRLSRYQENIPFWQWWAAIVANLKKDMHGSENLIKVSFLLWRIWLARNTRVFEDRDTDPQFIASIASSLAEEYTRLNFNISSS